VHTRWILRDDLPDTLAVARFPQGQMTVHGNPRCSLVAGAPDYTGSVPLAIVKHAFHGVLWEYPGPVSYCQNCTVRVHAYWA
jgi:hypothetical protein